MTAGAAPPRAWWRRPGVTRAVEIGFGLLVLGFGAWYVASRWDDLRDSLSRADPWWIVLAVVTAAAGQWAAAASFRTVLRMVGADVAFPDAARVFFVSQLGKYLPGSVWSVVALTQMGRRYGMSPRAGAVAGLLSLAFSLLVAGGVGAVLVLAGAAGSAQGLWWLLLLLPVVVALLLPQSVRAGVRLLLKVTRRPALDLQVDTRTVLTCTGWVLLSWLGLGLHCWALLSAFEGARLGTLATAVGGFALAYAAGTVFVPAPAGVGVREAVLAVCLGGSAAAGSATADVVVVTLVSSRVLLALLDFAQAGLVIAVDRVRTGRSGPPGPGPGTDPPEVDSVSDPLPTGRRTRSR